MTSVSPICFLPGRSCYAVTRGPVGIFAEYRGCLRERVANRANVPVMDKSQF